MRCDIKAENPVPLLRKRIGGVPRERGPRGFHVKQEAGTGVEHKRDRRERRLQSLQGLLKPLQLAAPIRTLKDISEIK